MIGTILAQCYMTPWADRAVSVERAGAGCPVTPQGARPYSWRHSRVRHPQLEPGCSLLSLELFSIIHLLPSSPSNPVLSRVPSHLPVTGSTPSTDSSRSSTRRVLRLARSAEPPLCLLLQQEKFTLAINQEVQFLNAGVLQHGFRHQKKFAQLQMERL